jgi:hypothetical protein
MLICNTSWYREPQEYKNILMYISYSRPIFIFNGNSVSVYLFQNIMLLIHWIDVMFMWPWEFNNIFAVCLVCIRLVSFRTSSSGCVRRYWTEIDATHCRVCGHVSVKSWLLFSFPYLWGGSSYHLESYLFSHCSFYIPGGSSPTLTNTF